MQIADGTVVISEDQQKGRGQMGNAWLSRKEQSLTFSIFKRFKGVSAEKQFAISMVTSLAITEALNGMGIPKMTIKWPNDILSGNKKVAGILIENVLEGAYVKHSIIGIGINVNEVVFPNLPQASSLHLATGIQFQLEAVFDSVLKVLLQQLKTLSTEGYSQLRNSYENKMFRKEAISVFENTEGVRFNGKIKGISEIGELLIETETGALQKFRLKEVKLIY